MASTLALLRRLRTQNVEFVLVGGLAAIAHGSASTTHDADVCIRFDEATMRGVFRALEDLHPYHRMTPQRLPLGDDPLRYVGSVGRPKDQRVARELELVRERLKKS